MVILGGVMFRMSEVPLYTLDALADPDTPSTLQGYLTYKKPPTLGRYGRPRSRVLGGS